MPAEQAVHLARTVHVVLPGDIDDPTAPSGGNRYDRRLCQGLTAAGWSVPELPVAGGWPHPDTAARDALDRALTGVPDGCPVLLDGLVACAAPEVVVPHAARLRLVVLVHLPLADETGLSPAEAAELDARERRTLRAAVAVVATSGWIGRRLVDRYGLPPGRVHVVAPGVDPAPLAPGTDGVSRLLCVASVTPRKGHDLLVAALAMLSASPPELPASPPELPATPPELPATPPEVPWRCDCVGALGRADGFVERVRRSAAEHGLADRFRLVGPLAGAELEAYYAAADLLVLPSRAEPYGMVVTEALARGVPVLATAVDGLPEALGHAPDGSLPGMLVPPGDPAALAGALHRWNASPEVRERLRAAARGRRDTLHGWEVTARSMAGLLARLPREAPAGG